MREIKFRCWYDNKIHKVVDIDFTYERINLFGADIISFKEGFLMQYTGLKDKNGKEIYEGDIVTVEKNDLAKIIWYEDRMAWGIKPINEFYFDSPLLADNTDLDLKIAGNIYENQELLEE